MRSALLLLAAMAAVHAHAGVTYDYVTTIESDRFAAEHVSGKVWVEGDSYRAEVARADGSRLAVISRDGDHTATVVNLRTQSAQPRQRPGGDVRSSSLFLWPAGKAELQGVPNIQYRNGGKTRVAGEPATKHLIEARFGAGSPAVGGTYEVIARIWTSNTLPALPMKTPIRTGYPEVDRQLDDAIANVRGMVLRHELEITRTLDGGPAQKERTLTTITKLERMEIPPLLFALPAQ
jgi:hypothetical protein